MDRAGVPRLRGTWIGTLLRFWNPVMRRLLASPLHWPLSRWFALLTYTGRKSGTSYTTPVSYVLEDDSVFLTSGDRWTVNLREPAPVRLRLRGRWRTGTGAVVADRDESLREHARLCRERPFFRRLAGLPAQRRGGADATAIERSIDAGRRLVVIRLDAWPAAAAIRRLRPRRAPARRPRSDC